MNKKMIHIGCGKLDFGEEWYNIDLIDYPHVDSNDLFNISFEDETVSLVYASHVLEYLNCREARDALSEWRRVLKFGGIMRLAVPNFNVLCDLYNEGKISLEQILGPVCGEIFINGDYIYHKMIYIRSSLFNALMEVGFRHKSIREWDWRDTKHSKFDDCSQAYIPHKDKKNGTLISLNIEAVK